MSRTAEDKRAAARAWRQANAARVRAYRRAAYAAKKTVENERSRTWKKENRERRMRDQALRNRVAPQFNRAARSLRRARERQAVPKWFDRGAVAAIFDAANRISDQTGILHHVDHIVPLASSIVCGLHWHENLQILPAYENQSKGNRSWPDMPESLSCEGAC